MSKLGCGEWHAYLQCRGGGVLTELPFVALNMGRRLDDVSEASVTITRAKLNGWTQAARDRCCGYLAELNPWEHELALWRGDHEAWVGPVLQPQWGTNAIRIPARDLFQWFARRLLEHDRNFVGEDLADIFYRYVIDALTRDPTPNISVTTTPTGVTGDRSIVAGTFRRADDELRELARTGVDFTALGRTILVGGREVDTPPIGPLLVEHFADDGPTSTLDGLDAASEAVVVGAAGATPGNPIMGRAGGIDTRMGLVQDVSSESSIKDNASAQAAAETRHDWLAEAPEFITGQLTADAPIGFDELVPGAQADLRLALLCRDIVGIYRLQDMATTVAASGGVVDETVRVTFETLGTVS